MPNSVVPTEWTQISTAVLKRHWISKKDPKLVLADEIKLKKYKGCGRKTVEYVKKEETVRINNTMKHTDNDLIVFKCFNANELQWSFTTSLRLMSQIAKLWLASK